PPRGGAARLPLELHHLRPGRPGPAREAVPRGARTRPEALHAAWDPQPDLPGQEPADLARRVLEPGAVVLRPDRGRRLPAVPAPALHIERRRLRRPADAHGRRPRALPRRAREVADGLSLHP